MKNLWCRAWVKDLGELDGYCKRPTDGGERCAAHMARVPFWPGDGPEVVAHLGKDAPQSMRDMFVGLGGLMVADCCGRELDACACRKVPA